MPIKVFHKGSDGVHVPIISRQNRLLVWPGVGAKKSTMNYVVLEPGEANVPHTHHESEDTICLLEGEGVVRDLSQGKEYTLRALCVVHVPRESSTRCRQRRGSSDPADTVRRIWPC